MKRMREWMAVPMCLALVLGSVAGAFAEEKKEGKRAARRRRIILNDDGEVGSGERAEKIRRALQSGDLALLEQLTHQLKGASGIYGFNSIAERANAIHQQVASGDQLQRIESEVTELADLCQRALRGTR